MVLVELAPLAGTVAALALRRGRMLEAGLVGLALAIPAAALALAPEVPFGAFLLQSLARGLWLAGQVIPVILAGLLFFEVTQRSEAAEVAHAGTLDPRRLWFGCFLLGPFCECATGVGVGLVIVVAYLRRLGLAGGPLLVFGLFSQIMVPWGALAIGTVLGAELARMPTATMGVASAWLNAPLLAIYLATFWLMRRRIGAPPRLVECLEDALWTLALWLLLWLANEWLPVDTAGLAACGALLLVRALLDRRRAPTASRLPAAEVAPFAILTLVLLLVRGVPAVSAWLAGLVSFRPFPDLSPFAVFQHASFWLAAVAVCWGLISGQGAADWRRHGRRFAARAWRPVAVTLAFVAMGELLAEAGISQSLGRDLAAALGRGALAVSPWIAAAAGFLTGTNVASNAMLMPMQSALAEALAVNLGWLAALQNVSGANFTLLSPIRVAMGAALVGEPATARAAAAEAYRAVLPLALAMLLAVAAMGLLLPRL